MRFDLQPTRQAHPGYYAALHGAKAHKHGLPRQSLSWLILAEWASLTIALLLAMIIVGLFFAVVGVPAPLVFDLF